MEIDSESAEKTASFVIRATKVPQDFFANRDAAKKYFRRFGKVKLVMFKPKRRALIVEYANEDGMLNALEVAGEYNGHVFQVSRDTETVVRKRKPKKDQDPDWMSDPEVKAELEAMGAFGPARTYNLRAEAMAVDPAEVPQSAKIKQRKWKSAQGSPKTVKKKGLEVKDVSMSPDQSDLSAVIKQQAFTAEEKFRVLDARDKLLRLKLKKNVELAKNKATVGTCPDMCPEKERLMREVQHQIAIYEQGEGGKGMNPRLAVKQYSRSSADQEAPLPQELRPVGVLQMTMGYLMHRIMDLCDNPDVNLAEWYHFLWDRTRGIRKDITQQELCCQGSVELVEQCARFHIFCSARLAGEDPSVFDQKINTENLTKCLQTLKYMYHDLQLKGESCKNEPEFRAYIILLNLNDGNFMWEVQQLKRDIQQSKEVKFALEVHSSLDKRNYVKFFKLVNSTTFLNACILMRYFIQMRVSAIKTLLKSYSPRVSQTSLPVAYLAKILAFESNDVTTEFFESYGLFTDVERHRILLDRLNFSEPEFPFVLDRAVSLVESKRTSSVGEVVCGKELPERVFERHVPQNSFTDDGFLKGVDEADSLEKKGVKKVEVCRSSPNIFAKQPEYTKSIFGGSERSIFAKSEEKPPIFGGKVESKTFGQTDQTAVFGIFGKSEDLSGRISTTKSLWSAPAATKSGIFGSFVEQKNIFAGEITPSVEREEAKVEDEIEPPPRPVVDRKKLEEEERKRRQEEAERRKKEEEEENRRRELEAKLLEEKRRQIEEARRIAAVKKKQLEEEKRRIEEERREALERKLAVNDLINYLLTEVEESIKEEKLAEISKKVHNRKLKNVVTKWIENTNKKRKRKAIDFNPLWLSTKTLREEAEELKISSQDLTLSSIKRYKKGKPCEVSLNENNEVVKIDLQELTYKFLVKKSIESEVKLHNELFWKVTVSLPNETELTNGLNYIEKVLQKCIQWKEKKSTTVLIEQTKTVPTITYCLEKQKGLVINKNQNSTNAFIFIANEFSEGLCKRIICNFNSFGSLVKIPVVFALQNYQENNPNLMKLITQGIIGDYLIIVDKFTSKNLVNIIEEALIFLSTKVERTPPLELDTLKSFLMKFLCTELWRRTNSFAKWNSNYKKCLKNPNTVIYLYNEALNRLKKILLNESNREHAKFPIIFKEFLRSEIPDSLPCDYKYFPSFWDNPSYVRYIEKILNNLSLPNFLENWPPNNQVQLELDISKYCTQNLKEPQGTFYRVMSVLLKNIDPNVNFKNISDVIWTEVVEILATDKLNQTNFSLYGTGFVNKSIYNQLIIVYDVNELNDYVKSDWFYINNPIIKQKILQLLEEEKKQENESVEDSFEEYDIDEILSKVKLPNNNQNVRKIKSELNDCKKLLSDLEDTFAVHKRILEKSGSLLKSIINNK